MAWVSSFPGLKGPIPVNWCNSLILPACSTLYLLIPTESLAPHYWQLHSNNLISILIFCESTNSLPFKSNIEVHLWSASEEISKYHDDGIYHLSFMSHLRLTISFATSTVIYVFVCRNATIESWRCCGLQHNRSIGLLIYHRYASNDDILSDDFRHFDMICMFDAKS